jgi:hypothetical protein
MGLITSVASPFARLSYVVGCDALGDRRGAVPRRMLEIQCAVREIYRWGTVRPFC